MNGLPFTKMHGLGNDFVVIDARARNLKLTDAQVRKVADRHIGVGCDQLIVIERAPSKLADAFMRILNADGSEVGACGNATRCVAAVLMDEKGAQHAIIETAAGLLDAEDVPNGRTRLIGVDMGEAHLDWRAIPLAQACDTLHVPVTVGPLSDPVCTNMGNPHATFFVPDADAIDLKTLGPQLEHHKIFPERANIGIAQILSAQKLRLRVWERGTGITLACGSGACAAAVAAARRGLTGRTVEVVLDGGSLFIEWMADNHVKMTGPIATSFAGTLDRSLLA
jgi:diaminopimelate epimerase